MKPIHLSRYDGLPHQDDLTPRQGLPEDLSIARVAEALRERRDPGDEIFDRLLPSSLQVVSSHFWTPLSVALRVARWLDEVGVKTVVDIGSGVGKFCIAAALCGSYEVVGIEQRPRLVRTARQLARSFRIEDRVHFLHHSFGEGVTPAADAYYLYNPFGENLFHDRNCLDKHVELSRERYARDSAAVESFLRTAKDGTYVVAYNGFGGKLPESYSEVKVARDLPNVLRLSCKVR